MPLQNGHFESGSARICRSKIRSRTWFSSSNIETQIARRRWASVCAGLLSSPSDDTCRPSWPFRSNGMQRRPHLFCSDSPLRANLVNTRTRGALTSITYKTIQLQIGLIMHNDYRQLDSSNLYGSRLLSSSLA